MEKNPLNTNNYFIVKHAGLIITLVFLSICMILYSIELDNQSLLFNILKLFLL